MIEVINLVANLGIIDGFCKKIARNLCNTAKTSKQLGDQGFAGHYPY
jgi:hypothetical protein